MYRTLCRGDICPLFFVIQLQRMISKNQIELIVNNIVQSKNSSLFLVDVLVSHANAGQKIVVYVDGDEGVSIDTCAEISRSLATILEEEDMIDSQYTLEVSSPGLDQPLKSARQYRKNVGRNIKVLLQDNQVIKGKLLEVNEEKITIDEEIKNAKKKTETKERVIAFDHIRKTNVLASFK